MSKQPPVSGTPPDDKLHWFDVEQYLHRIGIEKPEKPSLPFLRQLHRQHLLNVPFENLDIHWGQEILLDLPKLYRKVIVEKRGGFCYELNSLFCTLLLRVGFPAYPVSARIVKDDGSLTPEFEHMAILTEHEGTIWLADVGFGKAFVSPIKISSGEVQIDFNKFYRITRADDGWWLQESGDGQSFRSLYFFSPGRRTLVEFIGRCHFQQHDPASHFKKQKLVTRVTREGRITLTDRTLITLSRGARTEQPIVDEEDFHAKLKEHFGIVKTTNWA